MKYTEAGKSWDGFTEQYYNLCPKTVLSLLEINILEGFLCIFEIFQLFSSFTTNVSLSSAYLKETSVS